MSNPSFFNPIYSSSRFCNLIEDFFSDLPFVDTSKRFRHLPSHISTHSDVLEKIPSRKREEIIKLLLLTAKVSACFLIFSFSGIYIIGGLFAIKCLYRKRFKVIELFSQNLNLHIKTLLYSPKNTVSASTIHEYIFDSLKEVLESSNLKSLIQISPKTVDQLFASLALRILIEGERKSSPEECGGDALYLNEDIAFLNPHKLYQENQNEIFIHRYLGQTESELKMESLKDNWDKLSLGEKEALINDVLSLKLSASSQEILQVAQQLKKEYWEHLKSDLNATTTCNKYDFYLKNAFHQASRQVWENLTLEKDESIFEMWLINLVSEFAFLNILYQAKLSETPSHDILTLKNGIGISFPKNAPKFYHDKEKTKPITYHGEHPFYWFDPESYSPWDYRQIIELKKLLEIRTLYKSEIASVLLLKAVSKSCAYNQTKIKEYCEPLHLYSKDFLSIQVHLTKVAQVGIKRFSQYIQNDLSFFEISSQSIIPKNKTLTYLKKYFTFLDGWEVLGFKGNFSSCLIEAFSYHVLFNQLSENFAWTKENFYIIRKSLAEQIGTQLQDPKIAEEFVDIIDPADNELNLNGLSRNQKTKKIQAYGMEIFKEKAYGGVPEIILLGRKFQRPIYLYSEKDNLRIDNEGNPLPTFIFCQEYSPSDPIHITRASRIHFRGLIPKKLWETKNHFLPQNL